jgi:hypothetical protein
VSRYTPDDEDINGGEDAAREPFCTVCETRHDDNVDCPDDDEIEPDGDEDQCADVLPTTIATAEQRVALATLGLPTDAHDNNPKWREIAEKWSKR